MQCSGLPVGMSGLYNADSNMHVSYVVRQEY